MGSILDFSVMAWNRRDFFERVFEKSLSDARILMGDYEKILES